MHRVVLLTFVVACGGAGDTTIDQTFDPCAFAISTDAAAITDVQRAGIDDALALWGFTAVEGPGGVVLQFEDAAPAFHGVYNDETAEVVINVRITDPHALAVVIAHEFGHAFGLPHVTGRTSLMNPGNVTNEPTADDRAAVTALWGPCAAPRRSSRLR